MQVLRKENRFAILEARRKHAATCSDANGYDLITVPPGSTVGHDGQKMRVFTVKELRATGDVAQKRIDEVLPVVQR